MNDKQNNVYSISTVVGLDSKFKKLITIGMRNGNKSVLYNQIFLALVYIKEIVPGCISSYKLLETVLEYLEPPFELCRTKKSGRTFFIPRPCRKERRQSLAIKFFWDGVRYRAKRTRGGLGWAIACEIRELRVRQRRLNCYSYKKRREFLKLVCKYKLSARFSKTF